MQDRDFPFYNSQPVALTVGQWLLLVSLVAVAIALLLLPIAAWHDPYWQFVPALLFCGLPLAGLYWLTGNLATLYQSPSRRDVKWVILITLATTTTSIIVGVVFAQNMAVSPNAAVSALSEMSNSEVVLFFLKTLPQLVGEELFTIVPLLAIMTLCYQYFKLSRRQALTIAWIATALLFAIAHLSAYNWQLLQCIVVIGSIRLVLSLGYLLTKNLWVPTVAHIMHDWLVFSITLLAL